MCLTFLGSSQSIMVLILAESILKPSFNRMKPRYSRESTENAKAMFSESAEDFTDMFFMFWRIVRIDQDVI